MIGLHLETQETTYAWIFRFINVILVTDLTPWLGYSGIECVSQIEIVLVTEDRDNNCLLRIATVIWITGLRQWFDYSELLIGLLRIEIVVERLH